MCKFPLTGCLQNICNFFFAKLVQSVSLCHRLSKKLKFYQNLTSESGSKQRFSLIQEKAVIQAVCLRTQAVSIKARFLAYRKSQKISTAADQYFLSYVKKTTGGGSN